MMPTRHRHSLVILALAAVTGCASAGLRASNPPNEAIQEATLYGYTHLPQLTVRDSVQQRALVAVRRNLSRRGESQREWFARVSPEPVSGRLVIHLKHESGLRKVKRGTSGNLSGRDHSMAYVIKTNEVVLLGLTK